MSENRRKENNPFYGKKHVRNVLQKLKDIASNRGYLSVDGFEPEIRDLDSKFTSINSRIRKTALAINSDFNPILAREKLQNEKGINTPYRKKYIIIVRKN